MKEFWNEYKKLHSFFATRVFHTIGTLCGAWLIVSGLVNRQYWLCLGGVITAYSIAWASHWFIEHNSPLTLKNPLYALLCDIYMAFLILTRQNPKD